MYNQLKWCTLLLLLWISLLCGVYGEIEHKQKDGKILSLFSVVRFKNLPCQVSGGKNGTCYLSSQCTSKGGSAGSTCASGFGVCCIFEGTCGSKMSENCTYFLSSTSMNTPCVFTVCPCNDNICQLRLDFNTFTLAQPTTETVCSTDNFSITVPGSATPPVLCGENSGQHMYIESSSACNDLRVTFTGTTTPTFNIKITQLACDAAHRAPQGCLQYFTETTGTVQSFNYDATTPRHLADQQYTICIRPGEGYCSIGYNPTAFSVSHAGTAAMSEEGADCKTHHDYIVIPSAVSANTITPSSTLDYFCGYFLNVAEAGSSIPLYSFARPFRLTFVTNSDEDDDDSSTGFKFAYTQYIC